MCYKLGLTCWGRCLLCAASCLGYRAESAHLMAAAAMSLSDVLQAITAGQATVSFQCCQLLSALGMQ
jgi:hypothetical protein